MPSSSLTFFSRFESSKFFIGLFNSAAGILLILFLFGDSQTKVNGQVSLVPIGGSSNCVKIKEVGYDYVKFHSRRGGDTIDSITAFEISGQQKAVSIGDNLLSGKSMQDFGGSVKEKVIHMTAETGFKADSWYVVCGISKSKPNSTKCNGCILKFVGDCRNRPDPFVIVDLTLSRSDTDIENLDAAVDAAYGSSYKLNVMDRMYSLRATYEGCDGKTDPDCKLVEILREKEDGIGGHNVDFLLPVPMEADTNETFTVDYALELDLSVIGKLNPEFNFPTRYRLGKRRKEIVIHADSHSEDLLYNLITVDHPLVSDKSQDIKFKPECLTGSVTTGVTSEPMPTVEPTPENTPTKATVLSPTPEPTTEPPKKSSTPPKTTDKKEDKPKKEKTDEKGSAIRGQFLSHASFGACLLLTSLILLV